jgi:hypothetical protein
MKKRRIVGVVAAVAALLAGGVAPADAAQLEEVIGSAHGTVFPSASASGTPLLGRFQYHFTNGDHHIRQIAAMPLPQQSAVEVAFADENADDPYSYRVSHEHVDPAGIVPATFHGTCVGRCFVPLSTRPAGDFVFVLSGFRFGFDNGDHHFDMLWVEENGGTLTVSYKDTNGDDPFTYDVSYAWVPRSRIGALGTIINTVHAAGSATSPAFAGEKVIRGFFLDNTAGGDAGDNHIRDLGIVAQSTSFDVQYSDNNPGDSADWHYLIQYATLA